MSAGVIDLRSDTITRPSPAMREAMARAEVGDDVYGEDPTVRALELETARVLGKQDAVFVPSGTMANQLALLAQTQSGDEIWAHDAAHVVDGEQGGAAVLSRVRTRTFRASPALDVDELQPWLRDGDDPHLSRQVLACIENTMGYDCGRPYPLDRLMELRRFTQPLGIRLHCDGARLWNAAVSLGLEPRDLVADIDSVAVCFSKSLGAPVGSALAGDAALVARARRARKLLGGGMRQAGVIAAGALYALRNNVARLADDHRRARRLADLVVDAPGLAVDLESVQTNFVIARVEPGRAPDVAAAITRDGVACLALDRETIRFVTHLDVDDAAIDAAGERIVRTARALARLDGRPPVIAHARNEGSPHV